MYYFDDYDKTNVVDGYQRSIRDRANENLQTLKGVFGTRSRSLSPQGRSGKDQLTRTVHPRILTYQDDGRPQKYTMAASQLEHMLSSKVDTTPQKIEASIPKPLGPLPTPEEAATSLQHQAVYIQQLESENRYIKEEMAVLRMKIAEVLQENSQLHNELKTTVVHEIIREGGDFAKNIGSLDQVLGNAVSSVMTRHDFRRWQIELERLSSLHATKSERLESQLSFAKSEIEKYEKMVEDLKSQLRMQDSIPTRENGLTADITMSGTQRNSYQQIIDRLTRERDELMDHLTSTKARLRDMAQREEELYVQMKKGIELVEQSQLEQTEAMVQKEQLAEELKNMRQRFEAHVLDTQKKMQLDRESVRGEMKFLLDDLNNKLKESVEKYAAVESQLDKVTRDKMSLTNELDEIKAEFRLHTKETTVTSETFRQETTNASLQRQTAVQTAHQLRTKLDNLHRDRDQERSRLKTEIDDLRRRLHLAERDLVNSKEECILLTTNSQSLERELHLAKLARESIERGRAEDVKIIAKQSQQREEHYKEYINNLEERHAQVTQQMDAMLHKQNRLIMKLREECKKQALHLEKYTKKYRKECGQVTAQYEELKMRFEKTVSRLEVLEEQEDQHNRVHEKMKDRLKKMDEYAQFQSKQILDTLGSLSRVMRDRQLLAREVDFLRNQLNRIDSANISKLNSSSKQLVDEILNTITKEQQAGKGHLLLDPDVYKIEIPDRITIDDLV
ncbi:serologically defined colon cancer antigen 8 homolog [Gigantopelta aegis]|uniref:serologically defined colon cancer antigen 8 homolog n=1 Tax=Gigantopelta aegis TaxID=1735272 RepID=UPI001B889B4E|nr:serologically defined colon cancer antigen 8 homolog [Gigantopelta aegis]